MNGSKANKIQLNGGIVLAQQADGRYGRGRIGMTLNPQQSQVVSVQWVHQSGGSSIPVPTPRIFLYSILVNGTLYSQEGEKGTTLCTNGFPTVFHVMHDSASKEIVTVTIQGERMLVVASGMPPDSVSRPAQALKCNGADTCQLVDTQIQFFDDQGNVYVPGPPQTGSWVQQLTPAPGKPIWFSVSFGAIGLTFGFKFALPFSMVIPSRGTTTFSIAGSTTLQFGSATQTEIPFCLDASQTWWQSADLTLTVPTSTGTRYVVFTGISGKKSEPPVVQTISASALMAYTGLHLNARIRVQAKPEVAHVPIVGVPSPCTQDPKRTAHMGP